MSREILEYGQIKLSEDLILNPLYWDDETDTWKEHDLSKLGASDEDVAWVEANLTEEHKTIFKRIFSAT